MKSLFRVRVVVKAGVGALGRVTRAVEQVGGTISSVDLQSGRDSIGVCEMAVHLDENVADIDLIGDALRREQAGIVSDLSPMDHAVDPVLRAIRWACNLVGAGSMADEELKRVIGEICSSHDAWFLSMEQAENVDIARRAAQNWSPVVASAHALPEGLENSTMTGPVAMLAVPDARLEPTGIAVVARPASSELFSATEIDRVEAILALRRRAVLLDAHATDSASSWFGASRR